MRSPVGITQTVHAEVAVIMTLSEITAVSVFDPAVLSLANGYAVVAPLPYKAAHKTVIGIKYIPVILQVTGAVTHAVAVFAEKEGPLLLFIFKEFLHALRRSIHLRNHIQDIR